MFSRTVFAVLSLTALSASALSFAPSAAAASGTQIAIVTCKSAGLVDRKVEGSPVGVYGGGWITCDSGIPGGGAANTISVEVTLSRDGYAVAYDKSVCGLPLTGGGCSAGTPVAANPAGTQRWCAAVHTATGWGYSWSRSYCASY